MTEQTCRSIGALAGLLGGVAVMRGLGFTGLVPAAVLVAGGCVLGAIAAEKFYRWRQQRGG
jgi:hypothetical protein